MPTKKTVTPTHAAPRGLFHRLYPVFIAVLLVTAGALAYLAQRPPQTPLPAPPAPQAVAKPLPAPTFVDEQQCAGCHGAQVKDWQGSHHQLAMQDASEQTVLGDFNATTFKGEKDTTHFFRKGGEFWVNTQDGDGTAKDFKVAYAFGVAPLQQYLLQAPGGRLQALGVAWDTEKHRWFHIYPGQGVDFKDPLHWSKPGQNANFMCVECHTTGFKRNFDAASNTFNSQWNSLGVGCQACHGPASNHLLLSGKPQALASTANAGFVIDLAKADNRTQVDTCARCHARRAPLGDDQKPGQPLLDAYLPAALTRDLYELDGKIKGEVFEHGSFVQSKMFAKGVRCSNCHNPHSTELKALGNGVCLQCHNSAGKTGVPGVDGAGLQAKNYDSPEHHHHQPGQPGSQCVDCHMPGKLFMVNDLRHDHSFSLPNPALAQRIGMPDACLTCHQDLPAQQVIERFKDWYGEAELHTPSAQYAQSLWQARSAQPGAAAALFSQLDDHLLAAIRRATLVAELPAYPSQQALAASSTALRDPAPQVREAAVNALAAQLPAEQRVDLLGPVLRDPILAVRIASAHALLGAGPQLGGYQAAFEQAIGEYEQVQLSLQERAEANLNLALLYQATGRADQVEPYLRTALQRDGDFLPALVTLVQWLDARQRQAEADALLAARLKAQPQVALLQFTQGLALVRRGQAQAALAALREANRLEPDNARYAYVLALSLQDQGDTEGARRLLQSALDRHPENRDVRLALVAQLRDDGQVAQMKTLIDQLKAINPGDPVLH
ncbi:cytochrome c3 family protein [Pseudomonas sp. HR96]|uniref:tetratricopeptide repeat protein n=1 Tax=Pseudomonas sp. HR96 TaxID=1027966 RepID=UPI002A74C27B|nr:tetratricopeptide repeat protein [Pseudomonas sp. HR96]WPO98102.1 cytochrome c3 family protein [Pseudomonas sp. HR96]